MSWTNAWKLSAAASGFSEASGMADIAIEYALGTMTDLVDFETYEDHDLLSTEGRTVANAFEVSLWMARGEHSEGFTASVVLRAAANEISNNVDVDIETIEEATRWGWAFGHATAALSLEDVSYQWGRGNRS